MYLSFIDFAVCNCTATLYKMRQFIPKGFQDRESCLVSVYVATFLEHIYIDFYILTSTFSYFPSKRLKTQKKQLNIQVREL